MATTKSLMICEYVYKILCDDEKINSKLNGRVYPIVAEQGTIFPFVIQTKTGISTQHTKDGVLKDYVTVDINIVHNNYLEGCQIATDIRDLLDCFQYHDDEIFIYNTILKNISEGYTDNAYYQTLTFEFQVK